MPKIDKDIAVQYAAQRFNEKYSPELKLYPEEVTQIIDFYEQSIQEQKDSQVYDDDLDIFVKREK